MEKRLVVVITALALLAIVASCAPATTPTPVPPATAKPAATAAAAVTPASQATSKPPAATPTAAASASPKTLEKAKLSFATSSTSFLYAYMGRDKGIFKEEGLDLDIVVLQTNLAIPAVLNGELDYTTSLADALRAALMGEPIRAVVAPRRNQSWRVFLANGLTSADQIKGKAVAVQSIGSAVYFATQQALKSVGIDPANDVTFVAIAQGADQQAALRNNAVGAAALTPPDDAQARNAGLKEIVNTADVVQVVTNGVSTTQKKLKENPGQVKALIRGYLRSLAYIRDHRAEAVEYTMKQFNVDRGVAEAGVQDVIDNSSYDGSVSDKALPVLLDLVKNAEIKAKDATIDQLKAGFDFTLLQQAQKELGLTR